jgi:hypothetical protein
MKRRAMAVFLVAFAIWPWIQFTLTRQYDVDPWKLMGFAMYCVPGSMKTIQVYEVSHDGRFRLLDFSAYGEHEQWSVDRFRERRRALGRLASSDHLGGAMLALHPDFEGVLIRVASLHMDRASARLVRSAEDRTYWRDGSEEPFVLPGSEDGTVELAPRS